MRNNMKENTNNKPSPGTHRCRINRPQLVGAFRPSRQSCRLVQSFSRRPDEVESVRQLMICLGWLRLFQRIVLANPIQVARQTGV